MNKNIGLDGLRVPAKNNSTSASFGRLLRTSTDTYLDMRRMRLVDEPKSGAILWNILEWMTILPVIKYHLRRYRNLVENLRNIF